MCSSDASRRGPAIPQSFFGYSLDWGYSVHQLANSPTWTALMKGLTSHNTGPLVLRVGGAGAEAMADVPGQLVWDALAKLHKTLGLRFILCVGLRDGNTRLAARMIRKALATLPRTSIVAFEMGNEFEGWQMSDAAYLGLTKAFSKAIQRTVAHHLPLGGFASADTYVSKDLIVPFIKQEKPLGLKLLTAHAYGGSGTNSSETTKALLADDHIQPALHGLIGRAEGMLNFTRANGLRMRLTELNGLWSGGKKGVTNSFSNALWCIDAYLSAAKLGVSGAHYHTPIGSAYDAFHSYFGPYPARKNWTRGAGGYYGHWFLQHVLDGSVSWVHQEPLSGTPGVKIYALRSKAGMVRVVVLQKKWELRNKPAQQVVVDIKGNFATRHRCVLLILRAPSFSSTSGITLGGLSADFSQHNYAFAKPPPKKRTLIIKGKYFKASNGVPGFTRFVASIPPVSAVLMQISKS